MSYRIFISTGEVSGDLQGALLIEALQRRAESVGVELEILALGGDRMAQAGATLLGHTSAIGSMGLLESVPYILPTWKIQRRVQRFLQQDPPDLVILVDYMGPNLAIGSHIAKHLPQVPVVYYIAPQEWVWSISVRNTERIVRITDLLLAIFPEEARYFQENGASVIWVGHPLVDRVKLAPDRETARAALGIKAEQRAIALLPASRQQELKYLLPVMFEAARQIQAKVPDVHFWIPLSLEQYRPTIEQQIKRYGLQATVLSGRAQEAIAAADLALTKSGTANLEIALLNVPQVVVYRLSPITAWVGTLLKFSIPFASPVNLTLMKAIVPEFIQEHAKPKPVADAALELLLNSERRQQMLSDYRAMRAVLGEVGVCDRVAKEIFQLLDRPVEKLGNR